MQERCKSGERTSQLFLRVEIKDTKFIFGLSSSAIGNNSEFEPKSDSKADIKKAFTKSLRGKKMNKKILSKFIEQIA